VLVAGGARHRRHGVLHRHMLNAVQIQRRGHILFVKVIRRARGVLDARVGATAAALERRRRRVTNNNNNTRLVVLLNKVINVSRRWWIHGLCEQTQQCSSNIAVDHHQILAVRAAETSLPPLCM
jgi:hypothetical protein